MHICATPRVAAFGRRTERERDAMDYASSTYRTRVDVSGNLNDRKPVSGVNTSRTCRRKLRNMREPPSAKSRMSNRKVIAGNEDRHTRPAPTPALHHPQAAPSWVHHPRRHVLEIFESLAEIFLAEVLTTHLCGLNHSCLVIAWCHSALPGGTSLPRILIVEDASPVGESG